MLDSRPLGTFPEYTGTSADKASSLVDEIDEDALLFTHVSSRTVLVPRVQSMQEYILKHHKRMVLSALNQQIRSGMLSSLSISCPESFVLKASNCTFDDMAFWRYDAHTLLADVIVHASISAAGEAYAYDLYCELWVDMRSGMSFTCGESGLLENKPQRDFWMLSAYLVPVLRKDEIEKGAEDLLLQYCPTALADCREHNAYLLADKMGLCVEHLPLFHQQGTLSILFFCDGTVQVADDEQKPAQVSTINIPAGTIVINTNAVHKDCCQLEIYHECIHYAWHSMFYRLQDMHNSDIHKLRTKHVVVTNGKVPTNPLKWMEWQARRGSFALMMPLGLMRPQIEKHLSALRQYSLHAGQKLDRVARAIARERDLPKFRVRARLIQMGYIAAKGALNFVDGAYIEPFAFSLGNGSGDFSFVIDRRSTFFIYNGSVKAKLCDGQAVYSAAKIESAVLDVVHQYFHSLSRTVDDVWQEQARRQLRSRLKSQVKAAKVNLERLQQQDARLRQEVMRSLMGESCFEPDMLKEMLSKNKAELADAEARLASLESEKDAEAARIRTLSSQIQQIHDWAGEFDSANNDTKKMILARMIEKITVDRQYNIVIRFFISPESFEESIAATDEHPDMMKAG